MNLYSVQLDVGGIPVIRVLREDHAGLMVPFGQRERAAGNKVRFTAPGIRDNVTEKRYLASVG